MRRFKPFIMHDCMKKLLWLTLFTFMQESIATEHNPESKALTALQEEIQWLQEETYVSTATKTIESIEKSGSTISIITDSDLKKMGARNLMDALKRIPGLGINQSNVGNTSVEVRGVKTDFGEKVLFLINGHPTNNNLVNGGASSSYDTFMIDNINRVEVIRGPGSALYGANAFIAVINVITKTAKEINGTAITVGAGSYKSKKLNVLYGNDSGKLNVAVNFNIFDTDGFKGDVESDAISASGQSDYWNQRYDFSFQLGYENFTLNGKYLKRQAGAYVGVINALSDDSEQEYIEYFLDFGYRKSFSSKLTLSSKLYVDHFEFDNLWEALPESSVNPNGLLLRSPIEHDKFGTEIQLEYQLGSQHKLLAGLMAEHQSQYNVALFTNNGAGPLQDISSVANWNISKNRDILAAFVQDIWDINKDLRLIAGARYDRYSDFGGSFNPRTSLMWQFSNQYNFIAAYGSAFRAPTFGDLYNTNNSAIVGNPDINPEEIDTFEFGVNGDITRRMKAGITIFQNNIKEVIASETGQNATKVYRNSGELKIQGAEIEFFSRLRNGSNFAINYTYQYPVDQVTKRRVAEVPIHKANASFNFRHTRNVNIYAGLMYRGSLNRADGDIRSNVDNFFTLDLALTVKNYIKDLEIKASIYNFFDKRYFDASPSGVMNSDYPKPGRNLIVELSYKL
ncbi:MAG: iron complex outermembrane receptor protein [Oleiphilaceae bacterium]|jgi:iron complex outermembrane receptor protein